MQNDQIKGILERFATVAVTMLLAYCVKRGWLGESDAATLTPAIVLLPSLAYGWWINRPKALLESAANTVDPATGQKPIIVASPEMAKATPETPNIISVEAAKVVNNTTGMVVQPPTT